MSHRFHVVSTNEFGGSGPFNPTPHTGSYGFEWGSMHRPRVSLPFKPNPDPAIATGEVLVPASYTGETYNAEFLQFDLTVFNKGDSDWHLPNPVTEPEKFVCWPNPVQNPNQRQQLKDFVFVTLHDAEGHPVLQCGYPGLFHSDTFSVDGRYFVSNRMGMCGQRVQMNDVPDGTYLLDVRVNPIYGECTPARGYVKFTGQNIAIVPEPAFPLGLVWPVWTK